MTTGQSSDIALSRALNLLTSIASRVTRTPVEDAPRVDAAAFRRYAAYFDRQTGLLADQLAAHQITVEQWRIAMNTELDNLHTTAYVIGRGGLSEMSQEDMADIQAIVSRQQGFLNRWARELAGQSEWDAQKIKNRAVLYKNAANATLQQATASRLGLPELPALPGDGSAQCLVNDRCRWRFEKLPGNGNWNAYWMLGVAEHCPTCTARAAAWNPLQIRNGVIVTSIDRSDTRLFFRR